MRLALFSCHTRRPGFGAIGDVFQPIWIGGEVDLQGRWLTDRDAASPRGETDALRLHRRLVRLHAPHLSFIGVEQEDRFLLLDPTPARDSEASHPRAFALRRESAAAGGARAVHAAQDAIADHLAQRANLLACNRRLLEDWLDGTDIVVAGEAPAASHHGALPARVDWRAIADALDATPGWAARAPRLGTDPAACARHDAVLMRSKLFAAFVQLWSDLADGIGDLALRREAGGWEVGGRLLAAWIAQLRFEDPSLRVTELPLLIGADRGPGRGADRFAPALA